VTTDGTSRIWSGPDVLGSVGLCLRTGWRFRGRLSYCFDLARQARYGFAQTLKIGLSGSDFLLQFVDGGLQRRDSRRQSLFSRFHLGKGRVHGLRFG